MSLPLDHDISEELLELYSELHLVCGRSAAALRLSTRWDAPEDEMLERFRNEEAKAQAIWRRITQLRP